MQELAESVIWPGFYETFSASPYGAGGILDGSLGSVESGPCK